MLNANVNSTDSGQTGQVTPEDVGRTSRTSATSGVITNKPASAQTGYSQDYALRRVDFSDPVTGQGNRVPPPPPPPVAASEADLKKPSLVFVRSVEAKPAVKPSVPDEEDAALALPAGTRLVARLQTPVSSAMVAPVVAVVEYNYERDGQIVLSAGAKVFGRLAQANPSGYVGLQFDRVEMPVAHPKKSKPRPWI